MLGLAFSLWPNESLNVSCKVKQIRQEGLRAAATASQLGAAGGQSFSEDRSISQLRRGCCHPALHRDGQAERESSAGNPYPLPLPSEGRVPNPRGKVDFGPSQGTESPAEGGSVLPALQSQAGTSYEGYTMGQAPKNAPLCHQMLQSWFFLAQALLHLLVPQFLLNVFVPNIFLPLVIQPVYFGDYPSYCGGVQLPAVQSAYFNQSFLSIFRLRNNN